LLQLRTLHVIVRGCIAGVDLAALVGGWTWFMLLRRPALSYFRTVYRFIEVSGHRVFMLWPSVIRELLCVVGAAPILRADLTAAYFHRTIASDASNHGAGVTATPLTSNLLSSLSSLLLTPDHQYLLDASVAHDCDTDAAALPSTLPIPVQSDVLQPLLMHDAARVCSVTSEHLQTLVSPTRRWYTVSSYPWHISEHINTLELRALLTALQWVLGHTHGVGSRILCWVDNATAVYVMRKGRSSAGTIAPVLRRIASLLLAAGMVANVCWIPSAANPADEPSRRWSPPSSLHSSFIRSILSKTNVSYLHDPP
jgi:hypothetical protein